MALDLRAAFGCADVWKIAFVAAAMSGPMLALGALWGTPYAVQAYGLSRPDAAFQMSYLLMGWQQVRHSGGGHLPGLGGQS